MKIKNIKAIAFIKNLEKAYTEGVYADTPANRKLGRVGMSYKEWTQKQQGGSVEQNNKEKIPFNESRRGGKGFRLSDRYTLYKSDKNGKISLEIDTVGSKDISEEEAVELYNNYKENPKEVLKSLDKKYKKDLEDNSQVVKRYKKDSEDNSQVVKKENKEEINFQKILFEKDKESGIPTCKISDEINLVYHPRARARGGREIEPYYELEYGNRYRDGKAFEISKKEAEFIYSKFKNNPKELEGIVKESKFRNSFSENLKNIMSKKNSEDNSQENKEKNPFKEENKEEKKFNDSKSKMIFNKIAKNVPEKYQKYGLDIDLDAKKEKEFASKFDDYEGMKLELQAAGLELLSDYVSSLTPNWENNKEAWNAFINGVPAIPTIQISENGTIKTETYDGEYSMGRIFQSIQDNYWEDKQDELEKVNEENNWDYSTIGYGQFDGMDYSTNKKIENIVKSHLKDKSELDFIINGEDEEEDDDYGMRRRY